MDQGRPGGLRLPPGSEDDPGAVGDELGHRRADGGALDRNPTTPLAPRSRAFSIRRPTDWRRSSSRIRLSWASSLVPALVVMLAASFAPEKVPLEKTITPKTRPTLRSMPHSGNSDSVVIGNCVYAEVVAIGSDMCPPVLAVPRCGHPSVPGSIPTVPAPIPDRWTTGTRALPLVSERCLPPIPATGPAPR